MRLMRNIGFTNSILIGIIFLLWISLFFISGLFSVYAWTFLKMILPIVGLLGIIINIILFIVFIIRKKNMMKLCVNLIVNIVLVFPLLMTMNIIILAYPNDLEHAKPAVTVEWPFIEQTVVGWGGDTVENNLPHVIWASERWAYDLVIEPYDIGSSNNEDYGIWNKEVYSPVSGTVIAAYDKEEDIVPGSEQFTSMEGNYAYIKIDETGTYLLLNHLKKDSVSVKVGDHVNQGDVIGRVGNSGSTSEPHLHIHHQKQDPTKVIYPILAEGLPLFFEDINGESMPQKGDVITRNIQ
ncbi:M23 family metallopeptidase [Metabacillus fastidiosus]|uniref:M23 family metallopeptidase n=1 Tax=Metabacillus fastidiosus TaxID=1458 RepID=UPI003D2872A8